MIETKQINSRLEQLNNVFNRLSDEKKILVLPLVNNAIFIENVLENLQTIICKEGFIDEYQNGNNQFGKKQSASIQAYNSLIKNYNSIITKLSSMLDHNSVTKQKTNKLEQFIKDVE